MTGISDIFSAISNNDIQEALLLLKKEPRESVDKHGQSPLMHAVQRNNLLLTEACLHAGFSPNQKNNDQLSPFIAAAANGFSDIFQLLLTYQPQVNQTNQFGGTALLPASEKGFLKIVQASICAGVPVNHVNRLGWTALLEAVVLGNGGFLYQEIILDLILAQADVKITDFSGNNAWVYADKFHQPEVLAILEGSYSDDYTEVRDLLQEEKYFDALRQIAPLSNDPQKLFFLGYTFEMIKDYTASHFYYSEGLKCEEQFAFYLANLEVKENRPENALSYLEEGERLSGNRFFYYHKTNLLRKLGRHEEAIEIINHLLAEAPHRVDYMLHKANSLRSLGMTDEALEVLRRADAIMPQNSLFKERIKLLS